MMKVLLVDDELDFLKVMQVRIESWGYDLVKAANGKEAIEAVGRHSPDVIVLDYMMPDMDGVKVLEEIRKIDKNVPVVMLTAYPDRRSIEGAENLGIHAYIPKLSMYSDVQFSLKEVLKMIEEKKGKKE